MHAKPSWAAAAAAQKKLKFSKTTAKTFGLRISSARSISSHISDYSRGKAASGTTVGPSLFCGLRHVSTNFARNELSLPARTRLATDYSSTILWRANDRSYSIQHAVNRKSPPSASISTPSLQRISTQPAPHKTKFQNLATFDVLVPAGNPESNPVHKSPPQVALHFSVLPIQTLFRNIKCVWASGRTSRRTLHIPTKWHYALPQRCAVRSSTNVDANLPKIGKLDAQITNHKPQMRRERVPLTKPLLTLMHCAASLAESSHSFIPAYEALFIGPAEGDGEEPVTEYFRGTSPAK